MQRKWNFGANVLIGLMICFIMLPILIIIPVSFGNSDMFSFPPSGFTLKHYANILSDERLFSSLWTSLYIGVCSTIMASVIGLLAALGIVKGSLPFKNLWESFFLGPLIVPLVTTGIGYLIIFVPLGLIGTVGIILAHSVIISPYIVRIAIASLRHSDPLLEEAALVHGASTWYTFYTVVLPQMVPAIISGCMMAFLVSLDEYTVTVFLAQADTITIPIRIFQYVTMDINPIVTALASVTVVISFILVLVLEKKYKIHRFLEM